MQRQRGVRNPRGMRKERIVLPNRDSVISFSACTVYSTLCITCHGLYIVPRAILTEDVCCAGCLEVRCAARADGGTQCSAVGSHVSASGRRSGRNTAHLVPQSSSKT